MATRSYPNVRTSMLHWFAIDLTNDQIEYYAKMDAKVWDDVVEDVCDTMTSDGFINVIVQHIMSPQDHWPLNYETGTPYDCGFWEQFYAACSAFGIVVVGRNE